MSNLYDDVQRVLDVHLDETAARKQAGIKAASSSKRLGLDASAEAFNPDEWEMYDGDTVSHRVTGEKLRITGKDGRSLDTFETMKVDKDGVEYNPYDKDPRRAAWHRRAYAKQFGKDVEEVSNEDLVNAGIAQRGRFRENMEQLRGTVFHRGQPDKYGRTLAQFDDGALDLISGGFHAGYYAPSNARQRLEDRYAAGGLEKEQTRSFARALTGDALTSAGTGAANLLNDLAAFTAISSVWLAQKRAGVKNATIPEELVQFFENNRGRIKKASDFLSSDAKVQREKRDAAEQEFLSPLFQERVRKYKQDDIALEDWQATLLATKDEFKDRLEYLVENPGRILDASFESIPYMLGIGAVGRAAANKATQRITQNVTTRLTAKGKSPDEAAAVAEKFLGSKAGKEAVDRASELTGVATIGATEATMNAATTYGTVASMTEEQLQNSEKYQQMRARGLSHDEARNKLAQNAFNKVLYSNFIVAGLASKVTGAGAFEANLLRQFSESTLNAAVKQVAITSGRATLAGARETAEETIQSGGGEFLSQLAQFQETGVGEVGPGIGTATAEGALTGLASGAGLSIAADTGRTALKSLVAGTQATADAINRRNSGLDTADEQSISAAQVTARAKQILEIATPAQIAADPAMLNVLRDARKHKGITDDEIPPEIKKFFAADDVVESSLQAVDDAVQANAKLVEPGKKESEVFEEKMGETEGPLGLGLRGHVNKIKDAINRGDQAGYADADNDLRSFIATQKNKLNALREMAQGILVQRRPEAEVVAEVQKKYDTTLEWVAPNPKVEATNRKYNLKGDKKVLSGSLELGKKISDELAQMHKVREALAERAKVWSANKPELQAAAEATTQTIQEDTKELEEEVADLSKFTILNQPEDGPSAEGGGTREPRDAAATSNEEPGRVPAERDTPAPREAGSGAPVATEARPEENTSPEGGNQSTDVRVPEDPRGSVIHRDPDHQMSLKELRELSAPQLLERIENLEIAAGNSNSPAKYEKRLEGARQIVAERTGTSETGAAGRPLADSQGTAAESTGAEAQGASEASDAGREATGDEGSAPVTPTVQRRKKRGGNAVVNLDPNAPFQLNEGQQAGFDKAMKFLRDGTKRTFSIIGSAGTGKTTLVNELLAQLKKDRPGVRVVLSSPTHRANSVIKSKNPNKEVETLHKILGLAPFVNLEEYDENKIEFQQKEDVEIGMPYRGVLVVDESSMINDGLFELLMRTARSYDTQILFLGDMAQLGPVGQETDSKALMSTDEQAEITQVMRAKNTQLLDESVFVREEGEFSNENDMDSEDNGVLFMNTAAQFLDKAVQLFSSDAFKENPLLVRVVAYTNDAVAFLNSRIREGLYGGDADSMVEGEILMAYAMYGKEIKNSLDYRVKRIIGRHDGTMFGVTVPVISLELEDSISGDVFRTQVVDPKASPELREELTEAAFKAISDAQRDRRLWRDFYAEKEKYALFFPLKRPNSDRTAVKRTFDYGYAHTIHKSQGGTYTYIMVAGSNIEKARNPKDKDRLRYVAVTRAEKGAFILTRDTIIEQEDGPVSTPETEAAQPDAAPMAAEVEQQQQVDYQTLGQVLGNADVAASTVPDVITLEELLAQDEQEVVEAPAPAPAGKTATGNVKVLPGVQAAKEYVRKTANAVYTLRLNNNKHYGNPFTHLDLSRTRGAVLQLPTVADAVQAYRDWLTTDKYDGRFGPELDARKQWILSQLPGLKGKELVYYKELNEPSHANVLDELVRQQAPESPVEATEAPTAPEPPVRKEILTGDRLEIARRDVYELQRMVAAGDTITKPEHVRLSNPKLNEKMQEKLSLKKKDGTPLHTPAEVADEYLSIYERKYNREIFDGPQSQPLTEEAKALTDAAAAVASGNKIKSTILAAFEPAVDLLGDRAVQLLGRWVGETRAATSWTKNVLELVRSKIKRKLEDTGLPQSARKMFRLRSEETSNLLAAIPNAFTLLNNSNTRRAFTNKLNANAREEQSFNGVVDFVNRFVNALQDPKNGIALGSITGEKHKNSPFGNAKVGKDGVANTNRLHEYALQFLFNAETGQLDPNIAAIMAIEAGQWAASSGMSTLNNLRDAINELIGRPEGTELRDGDRDVFGNGTLMSNVVSSIGQRVLNQANISLNGKGIDPIFLDELHSSIGAMALATLAKMDLVKIVPVSANVKMALGGRAAEDSSNEDINLVHVTTAGENGSARFEESKAAKDLRLSFSGSQRILGQVFSAVSYVRGPVLEAPAAPSMVSRANTQIPVAQQNNMEANSKYAWVPLEGNIGVIDRFGSDEKFAEAVLGSEDPSQVQVNLRKGAESKNASNLRSIRHIREWVGANGSKAFHFAYRMIRSGRIYIDSNTINPQADKLHRFMFAMRDWFVELDVSDTAPTKGGNRKFENFLIAVAQGLDIDASKYKREVVLEKVRAELSKPEVQEIVDLLKEDRQYTDDEIAKISASLPRGERMHALAALKAWADYQAAVADPTKKTIRIALPMETDGKTNGFASALLQMVPITPAQREAVKKLLRATGIYFKNDPYINYPGFAAEEGSLDNYEDTAVDTNSKVLGMLDGKIPFVSSNSWGRRFSPNDEIAREERAQHKTDMEELQRNKKRVAAIFHAAFIKLDRSFAKSPLMVVAYGSGFGSIRRALLSKLMTDFYEEMGNAQSAEAVAEIQSRALQVIDARHNRTRDYNAWKEAQAKKIGENYRQYALEYTMSPENARAFQEAHDAVFGHALQSTLEQKLGPMQSIRQRLNEVNYLMNLIFVENYKRAIDQARVRKGGREPSPRERKLILNQMIKQGLVPMISTPLSRSQLDQLETTSSGQVTLKGDRKGRAYFRNAFPVRSQGWTVDSNGQVVRKDPGSADSLIGAIRGYEPNMDVGVAALVKMIHSSDGAVNGTIMGKYPILNVHDAQVGNFDQIDQIATDANETFFNTHRNWNLAEETMKAFEQILPLLSRTDQRLSQDQKASIAGKFKAYFSQHNEDEVSLQSWINDTRSLVKEVTNAKKILFNDIVSVNQFAKDGTEYAVPQGPAPVTEVRSTVPTLQDVAVASTVEEVADIIGRYDSTLWARTTKAMVDHLTQLKENKGDIRTAIFEWLSPKGEGHAPPATVVLDVLAAVFEDDWLNSNHLENFRNLVSIIRPALETDPVTGKTRNVVIRLGGKTHLGSNEARYYPDEGVIYINEDGKRPIIESLLHEMIHAANVRRLEQMQKDGEPEFRRLLEETKAWLVKAQKGNKNFPMWKTAQRILQVRKNPYFSKAEIEVAMVTEYTAYLNATQNVNKDGKITFEFRASMNESLNAMARSLQNKAGNNVFYSSPEGAKRSLFDEVAPDQLTATSVLEIFERVKELESAPVSRAHQELFDRMLRKFIVPGLEAVDNVIVRMATNPNGTKNRGTWLEDPVQSQIFLEATSRNYFTSAVEQSFQEVALHEMFHAIFYEAIENDPAIKREVNRLFEKVLSELTRIHGQGNEWHAFLPKEQSTFSDLDKTLARQRYEHVFVNGAKSLHEFMAVGMTNPQFMDIMAEIDDTFSGDIRDGTIMGTFWNLVEKIIQFVRGRMLGQNLKVNASMEQLAGRIVKLNAKNKALAEIKHDEGYVTKKLDALNNAALRRLASITNSKLQKWAEKNSLSGDELNEKLKDKNAVNKLLTAARAATASTLEEGALGEFRRVFESSLTGLKKDHPLYQVLTEILPWADRNRGWIDVLRKSERLIDMVREQRFQHTRSALSSYFKDNGRNLTRTMRENITRVLVETDIVALTEGPNAMKMGQLLDLLKSPQQVQDLIDRLESEIQQRTSPSLFRLFNVQSKGLAKVMIDGVVDTRGQALNAEVIVNQWMRAENRREPVQNKAEMVRLIDRLTSLRAFQRLPSGPVSDVLNLMTEEMSRPVAMNGFTGTLGTHHTFKELSRQKLFQNEETQMVKGYTADVTDPEVEIKAVMASDRAAMKEQGYKEIGPLRRDDLDSGPQMYLFKRTRGINQFSKSIMSLTGKSKAGTGMYDSIFTVYGEQDDNPKITAARARNQIARMRQDLKAEVEQEISGTALPQKDVHVVPLYNPEGDIVDFRYIMSKANKREHLKKRDMFDEVLPRMMASIEDRTNTKVINEEAVDLLYEEFIESRRSESVADNPDINKEDTRFVIISKNSPNPRAKELWDLLPKETKDYAKTKFGGDFLLVRDDVVNLVLGFRKIGWSDSKFLAPAAPVVDIAEKIWLEVIQWTRFKIAVLTPAVVFGNMVSNFALLLSQGIPPQYIIRESRKAILSMRAYQKDLRQRNELELTIANMRSQGKNPTALEQKLIRLNHALETSTVKPLVEEGMFTSIVEEFGLDEDSIRRQATTKLLDRFGGYTGSHTVVKVAQEAFMVPGSETAAMALMATQYGDFVGRYVKFNWDTKVKKVDRRTAIHEALDTFIYYNIPQNRWLQFLNDNGMMMFTKFFFRIQHIFLRTFKRNPVQATMVLGLQNMAGGLTGSRTVEENIALYGFLQNLTRKFKITPWEHINGDLLTPTILKWIPDVFFGD